MFLLSIYISSTYQCSTLNITSSLKYTKILLFYSVCSTPCARKTCANSAHKSMINWSKEGEQCVNLTKTLAQITKSSAQELWHNQFLQQKTTTNFTTVATLCTICCVGRQPPNVDNHWSGQLDNHKSTGAKAAHRLLMKLIGEGGVRCLWKASTWSDGWRTSKRCKSCLSFAASDNGITTFRPRSPTRSFKITSTTGWLTKEWKQITIIVFVVALICLKKSDDEKEKENMFKWILYWLAGKVNLSPFCQYKWR